jgi:Big-like domain-containing protein/Calx-beta domain-containing protein
MKRLSFLLVWVLTAFAAPRSFTATVSTLADSGPGSLREAIAAGGTVDFAVTGTITLTSGELVINGPLTINGPGAAQLTVQRSATAGTPEFRVLRVQSGSVTISGLTIRNGFVGATYGNGGGILNEGSLTLNDCIVSGNRSTGEYTRGTGVFNGSNATLIANRCVLADNAGAGEYSEGGGLYVFGEVTLNDSTVSGNSGGGFYSRGGGMHVDYFGTGHVARCTFSGNSVAGANAQGGGIYNYGTLQIINSTLSGNNSGGSGGGMHVDSLSLGTAIRNCTISGNAAPEGSGIYNNGFEPGHLAQIAIRDSIVAGNLSQDIENNGSIVSGGHNLLGLSSGNTITPSAGDQLGVTAAALKLGLLADNGGPTRTRALLTGSPAIDAGSETGFPATDQRGMPRPFGPRADIGAFEGDQPPPPNQPPTVRIVSPSNGETFTAPTTIMLIAQADDPDGYFTIQTVEFFANNASLGIRTNFATMNPIGPFFLAWTNVPAGEYTLTARATDDRGAQTASSPVHIRVVEPAIAIHYPREGDTFTTPTNLPVVARVFVAVSNFDFGAVTNVEFFANNVKLGEVHSGVPDPEPMPPFISFTFTWPNPPPGSYALTAKAATDSGARQTSLPVHITVRPTRPVVNVEASKADAYELGDFKSRALIFRVTRTDPIDFDLPVSYRVGGTAQNGVDYEELSSQVIIPNGAREATISTSARFDEIPEGDETVEVTIERPACNDTSPPPRECYQVGEHGTAHGLIHDASVPLPIVSLELVDPDAAETLITQNNIDWAEFRVRRTGPLTGDLVVLLNTQQGSARLGEDYWLDGVNNGSSVRIPAGASSVPVRLYPIDDDSYEGDETAFFHLIPPPPMGIPPYQIDFAHSSVAMVIHDNDPITTRLEITSPLDGRQFQPGDTIELRAQIIGPGSDQSWSVDFFDGDQRIGTTRPGAPLWWNDASGGQHVIRAQAYDPVAVPGQGILIARPVTILVGPGATLPVVRIGVTPWQTGEPCPGCFVVPSVLTIERTSPTNTALTVFLAIDGTATAGDDYQALPASVEIPAGQRSAQLTLLARDDQLAEGPEIVRVRVLAQPPPLLPPTYFVNAYAKEALIVISDDEAGAPQARLDIVAPANGSHLEFPSVVQLSAFAVNTQNEVYGPVEFYAGDQFIARSTVTATTRPAIPGLPSVHTAYWTNPPVGQYVLTARTRLSFSQSITSPPVNVTVDAPTFPVVRLETLPLQNAQAREFCPPNMDCAYPSFVVRRSGPTNADLRVYLSYSGSATAGADYPLPPGSVVIPAGQDAAFLMLVPTDDTLVEGPETVIATFTAVPGHGYIQDPNHASATITIIDNERPLDTVVSIGVDDPIASETSILTVIDPARFRISRTGDLSRDELVFFSVHGSATAGVDYPDLNSPIRIPAGERSVTFDIIPRFDQIEEGMETVLIRLEPSQLMGPLPTYEIAPGGRDAIAIILDNGSFPTPGIEIVRPEEGNQFAHPATVEIVAAAYHPTRDILRVDFHADGVKIGESIVIFDKPTSGGLIVHRFTWNSPPGGVHLLTVRGFGENQDLLLESRPVRITVGPVPPIPLVSIVATQRIAEESSAPFRRMNLIGEFTISRTGPTNQSLSFFVQYSGMAAPGVDYPSLHRLVTIPAGASSTVIRVEAIDDHVSEGIETVVATLAHCGPGIDPATGILCIDGFEINPAHQSATVFIRDDGLTEASLVITKPSDGASFPPGQTILIEATAIDLDGYISHVEFWDGEQRIGVSSIEFIRAPDPGTPINHSFEWRGATAGLHTLTARTTRADGTSLQSQPVRITVGSERPLVRIEAVSPVTQEVCAPEEPPSCADFGVFRISRTGPTTWSLPVFVQYSGSATPGADYRELSFLVTIPEGSAWTTIQVSPVKDGVPEGIETVVATISNCPPLGLPMPCIDFEIDPIHQRATVFIRDDGLTRASLVITKPKDGDGFHVGEAIPIEAIAIALDEGYVNYINCVEFWDGERKIGESRFDFVRAPLPGEPVHHNFSWLGASQGAHVLTARLCGPTTEVRSRPVRITVGSVDNQPPAVAITRPPGGAQFPLESPIEIIAETRDADGFVRKVEFFADGRKIGERNVTFIQPPPPGQTQTFDFVWRFTTPGLHVLTARATDDDGGIRTSALVEIRVAGPDSLPIITVAARDAFAVEPASNTDLDTASFRIRRFGPTNEVLAVSYSLHGTAENGVDYERLSGQAVIPAGQRHVTVTVRPLADNLTEQMEPVILQLEDPPGEQPPTYRVGRSRRAVAVISDALSVHPASGRRCIGLPGGLLHICFLAQTGQNFRVEASSDLRNWETVFDTPAIDGVLDFVDDEATNLPHRFYRLTPEPIPLADE